ncbi:MAG TPA: alginate export family protein [Pyrinomonadaceae bacterium]
MCQNNETRSTPRKRTMPCAALLFMLISALASAASAQTTAGISLVNDQPKPAAPSDERPTPAARKQGLPAKAPKQLKLGKVNVSGSLRLRAESYGWFETPGFEDEYTFGAAQLRLSLGQQREKWDWLVEGQFTGFVNLPERAGAVAPQGQLGLGASYSAANGRQDASAFLKQAYVRAKGVFGDRRGSLKAGRFEFVEGAETTPKDATLAAIKRDRLAHRLIGNFGFSHVGRSFDAVQYVRENKSSNLTLVGGRAVEGVFQLRALKELDVDFWYGAYTKPLHAARVESELRLFGLHYHDGRGALKTDNRTATARRADAENIRVNTVGGHYIVAARTSRGTFDALAWGVGQFGAWGTQSHRAGAIAFEGGFQPGGALSKVKTWVRAGYFRGTGDGDPSDDRHTTFFQMLPTPRVYARFPFYNLMNNEDVFAQLQLKPHARLSLRADVRRLRLSNANDLWYAGGGAFQETSFGYQGRPSGGRRSLGTLFDLSADVTLTPTTTLTLYGAGVRGGGVQAGVYPAGGVNPTARLLYVELTRRF